MDTTFTFSMPAYSPSDVEVSVFSKLNTLTKINAAKIRFIAGPAIETTIVYWAKLKITDDSTAAPDINVSDSLVISELRNVWMFVATLDVNISDKSSLPLALASSIS